MIKSINLLIKQECANLVNNECIGVSLNGKLFNDTGICHLIKDKKPCWYFKKSVLPLEPTLIDKYKQIDEFLETVELRHCKCGESLQKHKRFCDSCSKKNKLESKRKNWHKKHGSD